MLDEILARKLAEVAQTKQRRPLQRVLSDFVERALSPLPTVLSAPGLNIIAEIKYCSPSRGEFSCCRPPVELAQNYADNGAAAISILTEKEFFKGSLDYLVEIRKAQPEVCILRKDFIFDPYQVAESRAAGASSFLLIVAALQNNQLRELIAMGREYSMEPLVEVHTSQELDRALLAGARLIGINNRDLRTFEVRLQTSFELARRLEGESGLTLVSESGLQERTPLLELREAGFSGFLIGSHFMDSEDPGRALRDLL